MTRAWLLGLCVVPCAAIAACSGVLGIDERTLATADAGTLCETYCSEALAACTGANAIYASVDACMNTCARLPQGTEADTTGNTIGCRLHQARLAAQTGEVTDSCPRAGPGGDGVCGSNCEGFCTVMVPVCGADWFEDVPSCVTQCAAIPDHGGYNVNVPLEDSIQCRLYHLTSATVDTEHCAHAGGALKCVPQDGGADH